MGDEERKMKRAAKETTVVSIKQAMPKFLT
jgi:hypothetical protein